MQKEIFGYGGEQPMDTCQIPSDKMILSTYSRWWVWLWRYFFLLLSSILESCLPIYWFQGKKKKSPIELWNFIKGLLLECKFWHSSNVLIFQDLIRVHTEIHRNTESMRGKDLLPFLSVQKYTVCLTLLKSSFKYFSWYFPQLPWDIISLVDLSVREIF